MVSDLGGAEHCIIQSGKCVTNNSIILWNSSKNSLHKKIGVYGAPHNYASHVIISELQTYFNNKTKKKIGIKKKS